MSLLTGAIVGIVVRLLAKIPFVKNNPKVVVGLVSIAASAVALFCSHCASVIDALNQLKEQLGQLALGAATVTAGAIATHEIVIKKVLGPMNSSSSNLKPGQVSQVGGPSH